MRERTAPIKRAEKALSEVLTHSRRAMFFMATMAIPLIKTTVNTTARKPKMILFPIEIFILLPPL
jgi:hypothetical protein